MDTPSLVNLTPILRVMLLGLSVAVGPLAWWWLQHKGVNRLKRLQALTLFTLFLTFDLVIFGAFTRLTDSGLGCPDWPGCYGSASPLGAHASIADAQHALPTGPVTHSKAWIEMLHRYLATSVGVLILTLTVNSWWARHRAQAQARQKVRVLSEFQPGAHLQISPWWPTASLVWVSVVGAFGAFTVTFKLFPAIVTLHLLGALVLLLLLCLQAVRYAQASGQVKAVSVNASLRTLLMATFALLWLQIALGGWVSTNYAVLACSSFPDCQNSWWPSMNFQDGFTLWRELGLTAGGDNIPFSALTAIHYTHRLAAYVLFVALGLSAWQLHRVTALQRQARWLAGLALWQLLSGLSNVVLGWPLLGALAHTGGAAALVMLMTWTLATTRVTQKLKFKMQSRPHQAT
ncbi:MAG: COX15/CtaA family protein [Burkholderiaceae bacterium]|nr:COX15/CtaA family protein [Burkholderiaceae bacterium]